RAPRPRRFDDADERLLRHVLREGRGGDDEPREPEARRPVPLDERAARALVLAVAVSAVELLVRRHEPPHTLPERSLRERNTGRPAAARRLLPGTAVAALS